jgi:hypothetical protein
LHSRVDVLVQAEHVRRVASGADALFSLVPDNAQVGALGRPTGFFKHWIYRQAFQFLRNTL